MLQSVSGWWFFFFSWRLLSVHPCRRLFLVFITNQNKSIIRRKKDLLLTRILAREQVIQPAICQTANAHCIKTWKETEEPNERRMRILLSWRQTIVHAAIPTRITTIAPQLLYNACGKVFGVVGSLVLYCCFALVFLFGFTPGKTLVMYSIICYYAGPN